MNAPDAAYACPRGHRHYEGSAFCTVCGAGPVLLVGKPEQARKPGEDTVPLHDCRSLGQDLRDIAIMELEERSVRNLPAKPSWQSTAGACGMHGVFVGPACPKCVTDA